MSQQRKSAPASYKHPRRARPDNPHASQQEPARCALEFTARGYQKFTLSCADRSATFAISPLSTKATLVRSILTGLRHQSIISTESLPPVSSIVDVGCNSGMMLAVAFQCGFTKLLGIEHDTDYQFIANRVIDFCRLMSPTLVHPSSVCKSHHLTAAHEEDGAGDGFRADVVLALALVHWLYNCTSHFGSLDAIVKTLGSMCDRALVVEWVDPKDHAVKTFNHVSSADIQDGYTQAHFERALTRYFAQWSKQEDIHPTRKIYVAIKAR